jgi:hypothetical protein
MKVKILPVALFVLVSFTAKTQNHSSEIGIQTDDDSYLLQGSDRYYTAGTFIYYRQGLTVAANSSLENKVLGFEIGQKLYTPQSADVPSPMYVDRPFAGYLYIGSTLNLLYKNEGNLNLEAQAGVVGPAALGRQTQQFIHSTFGIYQPHGWQYQIDNNAVLNLSAQYNKLIARNSFADVSLTSYANLGNGLSGAGLGPMLRLGNFNQLFNSVSTQSTAIKNSAEKLLHPYELFFYYRPQINYVAYDATVQGGLFTSRSPNSQEITAQIEPLVFSQQFGVAYSGKRIVVDLAAIFHTKDVKQMVQSHQWGAITILYRFH